MSGRMRPIARGMIAATLLLAIGCAAGKPLTESGDRAGEATAVGGAAPSGEQLLGRRCVSCHDVPDPNGYSHEQWTKALTRMRKRVHLPEAAWDSLAVLVPGEEH
jgi:cytochrome c5